MNRLPSYIDMLPNVTSGIGAALLVTAVVLVGPAALRACRWMGTLTVKAIAAIIGRVLAALADRLIDALIVAAIMVVVLDIPVGVALKRIINKLL